MKRKLGKNVKTVDTTALDTSAASKVRLPSMLTNPVYDLDRSLFESSMWKVMLAMEKQILRKPSNAQVATDTAFRKISYLWYDQRRQSVPAEATSPSPADMARARRAISSTAVPAGEMKDMRPQSEAKIVEISLPKDEKLLLGRRPEKLKGQKKQVAHVLQLSLTKQDLDRLERLRDRTNTRTAVDVVRRGLKLYEVVLDATEKGKDVMFESRSNRDVRERLRLS